MTTDPKAFVDVITKFNLRAKKRLMINIHSLRNEFYENKKFNAGIFQSANNHSHAFTNVRNVFRSIEYVREEVF